MKVIQFMRQDEFDCIIPCLGTFHTIKTLLKCIGKNLRGSGAENVFLNAAGYGSTMIEGSILSGGYYNRALEALSLLSEAINRLLYKEFFASHDVENYKSELETLSQWKDSVSQMDEYNTQSNLCEFRFKADGLFEDFKVFTDKGMSGNENFKYWLLFLNKMQIVFDLLRADREDDWMLHLDAVQRSLYEFAAWDSTNYLGWGSVYLEEIVERFIASCV